MAAVTSVPVFVHTLFPSFPLPRLDQHAQPILPANRATPGRGEEPPTRVRNSGAQNDTNYTALNTDGDAAFLAGARP